MISENPNGVVDPGIVRGNLHYLAGSRVPLEPPMGVREFFIQAFEARGGGGKSAADRSAALERRR